MSFHDSMIEDGYSDEEEYLEHLFDVADKAIEEQNNIVYDEYNEKDEDRDDDEDCYSEENIEYTEWICENPIRKALFLMWFNMPREDGALNDALYARQIYMKDEELYNDEVKQYYGSSFDQIMKYINWRKDNLIEEVFREPCFEEFDQDGEYLGFRNVLLNRTEEWYLWETNKLQYNNLSEKDKAIIKEHLDKYIEQNKGILPLINKKYSEQSERFDEKEQWTINNLFKKDRQNFIEKFYFCQCVNFGILLVMIE